MQRFRFSLRTLFVVVTVSVFLIVQTLEIVRLRAERQQLKDELLRVNYLQSNGSIQE